MEIKITDIAIEKINEAVRANNEKPILRIYVEKIMCSGARFGLAFDDEKEGDEITETNGIKFITDTEYMKKYSNGISIDYVTEPKEGFIITSLVQVKGCSGGCSGCGH